MSDEQREQVAQDLATELGFEVPEVDDLSDFYSEASGDDGGSVAEEPDTAAWVHEPTGREFKSEAEYLKYDNSWNQDKWGQKFKELEDKFERIAGQRAEGSNAEQPRQLSKKDIKKMLWPDQKEEVLEDAAFDVFVEGIDNALSLYGQKQQTVVESLSKQVEALQSQLRETSMRSQFGINPETEQKLVEKHTWLKGLPVDARMAAMKDLVGGGSAPEAESRKLVDKIPQRRAEDHVEGSASITPSEPKDLEEKISKLPEKEQLSVLGRMFAKEGEFFGWRPEND